MLLFGFDAANNVYIAMDDISVVNTANPSVQLLVNPSFENSSSSAIGWTSACMGSCSGGSQAAVITSGCRTGNCIRSLCYGGGVDYIGQIFPATVSQIYNITFWTQRVQTTTATNMVTLYAGIM